MTPPSGMASRALTTRLSSAVSTWPASVCAGGSDGGNLASIDDQRPERRRQEIDHTPRPASVRSTLVDAQFLAAGEGQHAAGQRDAALGALHGVVEQPDGLVVVGNAFADELEAAHHGHQQVVEIVRDAAGELADRFHLLGLEELLAGTLELEPTGCRPLRRGARSGRA